MNVCWGAEAALAPAGANVALFCSSRRWRVWQQRLAALRRRGAPIGWHVCVMTRSSLEDEEAFRHFALGHLGMWHHVGSTRAGDQPSSTLQ